MKHAPFVLLVVLIAGTPAVHAQTTAGSDSTLVKEALIEYDQRVRYGFLVDPFSVYSSTFGFGVRGVATLYNLPFTGSRLRATLRPYQRRGTYGLTLRSHDPSNSDVFGLLRVRYETNAAYRYYGLGPGSREDNRVFVDMDRFQTLARLGFEFSDDRFLVQPFAMYVWNKSYGLDDGDDPGLMDARSRENLDFVLGIVKEEQSANHANWGNVHSGVKIGMSLLADYRDRKAYPTSGALFEVTGLRYLSRDDFGISFNQFRTEGHAFVGLGGEHVLAFRALVEKTDSDGDDPVPFYLLPEIDFAYLGGYKGHRFVDNDLMVLTAEYRLPVVNLADLYQVSGFIQAGVGNVFESIGDMNLSVSFDRNLDPADPALRPGLGLGLRVAALEQGRDLVYWMLGFGPEGMTLAAFRFVHSLTDIN